MMGREGRNSCLMSLNFLVLALLVDCVLCLGVRSRKGGLGGRGCCSMI
jgi:hypothetical protein